MKKVYIVIFLSILLFAIYSFTYDEELRPAITYFPVDETTSMQLAQTTLMPQEQAKKLIWETTSESEEASYLRQDVSLLYANGRFAGALNTWKQDTTEIHHKSTLPLQSTAQYEAISFHFAEKHMQDKIMSLYTMSSAKLPKEENTSINTKLYLEEKLQSYLTHFNIKREEYLYIPLVSLIEYQDKPILNFSVSDTNIIIGHIWEGLYNKYILRLDAANPHPDPMPIILVARDQTHLITLLTMHDKMEMYVQHIP